ncbi:pentapeptide repeat-containing protein [Helicobacter macacae]|uniref:Pentapeptide repeat-containing protein n=1 Tax=Helicobacter macacae MIT 99-5501 TaxID=1357400 RepID=V8CAW8_9HELI|nr:pentapeptide repeat-containing protein [Helicobacter macacae]ETD24252.1 hypothetical protein HMPREF2086_01002 [Helicobacter macacae MIT 99-5501]
MPKRQICENLHFDSAKDKLILTIPSNHNSTINMRELCQIHYKYFPPNVIKKVGDTYIICKSLSISNGKSSEESKKCEIKARLCFSYIIFGEVDSKESLRIDFQHCEFHKRVYFTNCEFNGNVFFNHAVFERYADFHESIFNGVVSFYNAEFKYAPNFSTCVFQNLQATNFINVKIESLDFDKVKQFIKEYRIELKHNNQWESLKQDNNRCEIIKEHKIRYASNARDSFRTIKNVLIANNNLLDASTWHKLELYAKEHELKLQKPCLLTAPKKWCDLWQLKFYRHTSAHHTDLLKILSWFVVLVGGFATILFFTTDFYGLKIWWATFWGILASSLTLSIIFDKIKFFAILSSLSFIPLGWLLAWNPKYIFGVANLFGNDTNQSNILLNLILSLYSIAFILVIFSLQKTARKNSIIPN